MDLNATQAAIRAGYSKKTAFSIGVENLKKPLIQEHISDLRAQQSKRTEITADRVLSELAAIAFADRTEIAKINDKGFVEFTPTDKLPKELKKVISGIKEGKFGIEVATADKVRALELLGKHLGIFDKRDDNSDALAKLDKVLAKIGGES
ncbi:MAG: terminase small subunit [Oscillospiraceae bacterium]